MLGCSFGANRIGVILGGCYSSGLALIGCYFEASDDADIDIGHNTTDFSGSQLEDVTLVGGVTIMSCFFQTSTNICRVSSGSRRAATPRQHGAHGTKRGLRRLRDRRPRRFTD